MALATPISTEFPTLAARPGVVYLDSAATSQTPRAVLDAMGHYYEHARASIHRGVYPLAVEATDLYEGARAKVAAFAGSTVGETVFTRNATEAFNLVAYAWGRANVGEGDLVLVTEMEHHSNLVPWQMLCAEKGAALEYVGVDDDGRLDLDALDVLLKREPKLLAVTHVSNVLGTINPVAEIVARAHAHGTVVVVDGSQAGPHLPIDVGAIDADFYAWTAHKAYGPTGIGVLHGRRSILEAMPPFLGGGHMISKVGRLESTWAEPPAKFEAGTMPVAEAVGFGAAVEFLTEVGMDNVWAHSVELSTHALEVLPSVPGIALHGPLDPTARSPLISFTLEGTHPHDVAEILARDEICIRAGHHCAQPLMRRLGAPATSRASFALHTTREEIDALVDGLHRVRSVFRLG